MNRIRQFFNSAGFVGAVVFAATALLTYVFMLPNKDVHRFTRGEDPVAVAAAAVSAVVFAAWLYFLPKGAIKSFFKGPGFVGLLVLAFLAFTMHAFITA